MEIEDRSIHQASRERGKLRYSAAEIQSTYESTLFLSSPQSQMYSNCIQANHEITYEIPLGDWKSSSRFKEKLKLLDEQITAKQQSFSCVVIDLKIIQFDYYAYLNLENKDRKLQERLISIIETVVENKNTEKDQQGVCTIFVHNSVNYMDNESANNEKTINNFFYETKQQLQFLSKFANIVFVLSTDIARLVDKAITKQTAFKSYNRYLYIKELLKDDRLRTFNNSFNESHRNLRAVMARMDTEMMKTAWMIVLHDVVEEYLDTKYVRYNTDMFGPPRSQRGSKRNNQGSVIERAEQVMLQEHLSCEINDEEEEIQMIITEEQLEKIRNEIIQKQESLHQFSKQFYEGKIAELKKQIEIVTDQDYVKSEELKKKFDKVDKFKFTLSGIDENEEATARLRQTYIDMIDTMEGENRITEWDEQENWETLKEEKIKNLNDEISNLEAKNERRDTKIGKTPITDIQKYVDKVTASWNDQKQYSEVLLTSLTGKFEELKLNQDHFDELESKKALYEETELENSRLKQTLEEKNEQLNLLCTEMNEVKESFERLQQSQNTGPSEVQIIN